MNNSGQTYGTERINMLSLFRKSASLEFFIRNMKNVSSSLATWGQYASINIAQMKEMSKHEKHAKTSHLLRVHPTNFQNPTLTAVVCTPSSF